MTTWTDPPVLMTIFISLSTVAVSFGAAHARVKNLENRVEAKQAVIEALQASHAAHQLSAATKGDLATLRAEMVSKELLDARLKGLEQAIGTMTKSVEQLGGTMTRAVEQLSARIDSMLREQH